jgi:hypothetical protein
VELAARLAAADRLRRRAIVERGRKNTLLERTEQKRKAFADQIPVTDPKQWRGAIAKCAPSPPPSSLPPSAPTQQRRILLKTWVGRRAPEYIPEGANLDELKQSLYERMAADAKAAGVKKAHWTTVRDYVLGKSNKR